MAVSEPPDETGENDDPFPARKTTPVRGAEDHVALNERQRRNPEDATNASDETVPETTRWRVSMETDCNVGDRLALVVLKSIRI
jgi:hypothetical protein